MPLAVADEAAGLNAKVAAYIEFARQRTRDGLTVPELAELILGALRLSIAAVDTLSAPGADKKATVIQVAATVFDAFADQVVPLALRPVWWVFRPAARSLVCSLAAGAVEVLLPLVRSAA
jgi:hypothetical protein